MITLLSGLLIFYLGRRIYFVAFRFLNNDLDQYILDKFKKSGFCSLMKLSFYYTLLSEMFHYYTDIKYIFWMPHWNWIVALVLLLAFYWSVFIMVFGLLEVGAKIFYVPEGGFVRKWFQLLPTLVLVFFQMAESLSIGYTWTNYFALFPILNYLTAI